MIKAFALTGRIAKCYLIPRGLPWARSFCPFRACCRIETFGDIPITFRDNLLIFGDIFVTFGDIFVTFGDIFVTFGDIFITFGDNFVIFGDIIPYPDFEAIQPVRRSYLPRTY